MRLDKKLFAPNLYCKLSYVHPHIFYVSREKNNNYVSRNIETNETTNLQWYAIKGIWIYFVRENLTFTVNINKPYDEILIYPGNFLIYGSLKNFGPMINNRLYIGDESFLSLRWNFVYAWRESRVYVLSSNKYQIEIPNLLNETEEPNFGFTIVYEKGKKIITCSSYTVRAVEQYMFFDLCGMNYIINLETGNIFNTILKYSAGEWFYDTYVYGILTGRVIELDDKFLRGSLYFYNNLFQFGDEFFVSFKPHFYKFLFPEDRERIRIIILCVRRMKKFIPKYLVQKFM